MTSPERYTPTNAIDSLPRLRGRTPLDPSALVLSVLIPVYNELHTIEIILDQVHAGIDILKVFQSFASITYRENGIWVTHRETIIQDVP